MKNIFKALMLFLCLAPTLLLADMVGVAFRHPQLRAKLRLVEQSNSVLTTGYNPLRNPTTHSSFSARNFSPLTLSVLPNTQNALPQMPLYLNGSDVHQGSFPAKSKLLFYGTRDGYFNAYSLTEERIAWSLPLSANLRVTDTPAINLANNKIFFLASPDDESESSRLFSVDFNGQHIDSIAIESDDITTDPSTRSTHCGGSLTVIPSEKPLLLFLCQVNFKKKSFHPLQSNYLISIPLHAGGDIDPGSKLQSVLIASDSNPFSLESRIISLDEKKILVTNGNTCLSRYSLSPQLKQEEAWPCPRGSATAISFGNVNGRILGFMALEKNIYGFNPFNFSEKVTNPNDASDLHVASSSSSSLFLSKSSQVEMRSLNQEALGESLWRTQRIKANLQQPFQSLLIQYANRNQFLYLEIQQINDQQKSLAIFDGNDGKILENIAIPSDVSPAPPLLVDEQIYVHSNSLGILRLSRDKSWKTLLSSTAYFKSLWTNIFARLDTI